ncbi:hypothetical protein [Nocardioides insulae]|nr:hypothetical protein [Nocardioides insulae]
MAEENGDPQRTSRFRTLPAVVPTVAYVAVESGGPPIGPEGGDGDGD